MTLTRVLPLAVVTLFIWGVRLRNVIEDEGIASFGGVVTIGFLLLGLALAAVGWFARHHGGGRATTFAVAAAGITIVWWVVRMANITFTGDHSVGFIVVHAVLAAASIGAAVWLLGARRPPVASPVG